MNQRRLDFARNKALEPSIDGFSISYRLVLLRKYFYLFLYDGIGSNEFFPIRIRFMVQHEARYREEKLRFFGGRMSNTCAGVGVELIC